MSQQDSTDPISHLPNPTTPAAPSTPMFQTPRPSRLPLSAFTHPDQFNRQNINIHTIDESDNEPLSEHSETKDHESNTINENTHTHINNQSTESNDQQNKHTSSVSNQNDVNLPEMQHYVLQMEQQKHMLEQQLQQQQQEIAHLRYEQAWHYQQQNQRPAHNVHQQLFKSLAKPDIFNGNTGDDLDSWLAQIINYIKLTGIPLNMAAQFASTYLKGSAWTWFSSMTQEQLIGINDLDSFVLAITRRFKPLDNQHMARIKLQTLVQTGSVSKYNELFNTLMQQLPKMDPEDRKFQYMDKLKDSIQTALAATVQPHHSLTEIQLMALKLDSALFNQRNGGRTFNSTNNFNGTYRSGGSTQFNKPTTWTPGTKPIIAANVINAAHSNVNEPETNTAINGDGNYNDTSDGTNVQINNAAVSVPKLTPEIREHCRRNRLCFRCRRHGHLSINCPTFNNSSNFNSMRPSAPLSKK
jgi:hypothetical protein